MNTLIFDIQKESTLSGLDLSRKGSVDSSIKNLVEFINKQKHYFTTSSCSGRILIFQNNADDSVKKKGCHWLFTSHDCIEMSELTAGLNGLTGEAVFKFEPLILHIQCRNIQHARKLHSVAVASGLRNSGISVGNKGKIIMAVRSTHMLEVPLSCRGEILVSNKYLEFLVDCANKKMKENSKRIDRFFDNFIRMIESSEPDMSDVEISKRFKQQKHKPSSSDLQTEKHFNSADSCLNVDNSVDVVKDKTVDLTCLSVDNSVDVVKDKMVDLTAQASLTSVDSELKLSGETHESKQSHSEIEQSHHESKQSHSEIEQSHHESKQSHSEIEQSHHELNESLSDINIEDAFAQCFFLSDDT